MQRMSKTDTIVTVHYEQQNAIEELAYSLKNRIKTEKQIKFICIGTDRSTGDSLGPLVGSFLKEKGFDVIGTLDEPVHAMNLYDVIELLPKELFIFAIDACLSTSEDVGLIRLKNGPLKPGSGVNKDLPVVGDLHIIANVNSGGFMEYMVLQNTPLSQVMKQAKIISGSIEAAVSKED
jgi:putative sporulation protein YyaC